MTATSRALLIVTILVATFLFGDHTLRAAPDSQTLGRGYDTQTGEYKGVWVTGIQAEDESYHSRKLYLKIIESTSELYEELGIDFKAGLHQVIYSVDLKASFANQHNLSSSSIYVFAKVKVVNHQKFFRQAQLDPIVANYLLEGQEGSLEFQRACGDRYVSGELMGRELYGLLEIKGSTKTAYNKITASLGGRYKSFSASVDFRRIVEEITKNEDTSVEFETFGNDSPILTGPYWTVGGFLDVVTNFFDNLGDEGKVMEREHQPYSNIFLPDTVWQQKSFMLEDKKALLKVRDTLDILWEVYPDKAEVELEIQRVDDLLYEVNAALDREWKPDDPYNSIKYRGEVDKMIAFVEARHQARIDEATAVANQFPVGGLLAETWKIRRNAPMLRIAKEAYNQLAQAYFLRQNFHERIHETDLALADARRASLYLGLFYVLDNKHAKGWAEIKNASMLGLRNEPILDYFFQVGWPYGSNGDLRIVNNEVKTLLAGSLMDYTTIQIDEGCKLIVVPGREKDSTTIESQKELAVQYNFTSASTASEVLGILNNDERYYTIGSTRIAEGSEGSITVLGCRGEFRLNGEIVYADVLHNGIDVAVPIYRDPTKAIYEDGNPFVLSYACEQMPGGNGGNGGNTGAGNGGSGAYGFGGGGGGGNALAGSASGGHGGTYPGSGEYGGTGGAGGIYHENEYFGRVPPQPEAAPKISHEAAYVNTGGAGGHGSSQGAGFTDARENQSHGGTGGHGGMKGLHGGPLCLMVKGTIEGTGSIDLSGTPGKSGLGGSSGWRYGWCYASGGGGGGGGAGGSGGQVWIYGPKSHDNSDGITDSTIDLITIKLDPGSPGDGGRGGTSPQNGTYDQDAGAPGQPGTAGVKGKVDGPHVVRRFPVITVEPLSQTVCEGSDVTFYVEVDLDLSSMKDSETVYDTVSYIWSKTSGDRIQFVFSDVYEEERAPGEEFGLTIRNVKKGDAGIYRFTIGNIDEDATVQSQAVELIVSSDPADCY